MGSVRFLSRVKSPHPISPGFTMPSCEFYVALAEISTLEVNLIDRYLSCAHVMRKRLQARPPAHWCVSSSGQDSKP